ncbi:CheY-like superfamily [Ochromonadaceae sp. CCMP2298]|nr:CheY-like superfamily [Ochromonadaceae sp. CCMP2298]|mmetsp:Transcript_32504/g.71530  ORF Transcript_32504/g.71530 Transcript_32504/m.71530 type:complete len:253 (-) Transcript_32504:539-1297(-)
MSEIEELAKKIEAEILKLSGSGTPEIKEELLVMRQVEAKKPKEERREATLLFEKFVQMVETAKCVMTCMPSVIDTVKRGTKRPVATLASLPLVDEELAGPKRMKILAVDDALSMQKVVSKSLQLRGHSVVRAENGAMALDILGQLKDEGSVDGDGDRDGKRDDCNSPFDVVLMDLQMPVMDGIEAIKQLRASEARKGAKAKEDGGGAVRRQVVVAMSANNAAETRAEALIAGADYFIAKPFTMDTFEDIFRV